MATELSRDTFVINDTGEPVFIIEQGRAGGDTEEENYSRFKVVAGNRTIRSDLASYDAARTIVDALGAVETVAGDARALAAEIGGTSVLQAALAPRVTELAAEVEGIADRNLRVVNPLMEADDDEIEESAHDAKVLGEGTRVPDSQATGVMEITTGLGGVRRHGLGERFEGAADHAEEAVEASLTADGATEDNKRGMRARSSATAAKSKTPSAKRKRPSRAKAKTDVNATSPQTDAEKQRDGATQNPSVSGSNY